MERRLRALVPLAASAALILSTGRASAEEQGGPWLHLRFTLAAEGGVIVVPGFVTVGLFGGQGLFGVRFNKVVGLMSGMDLGVAFGKVFSTNGSFPLLVELTFWDRISIRAGPELGFHNTRVTFGVHEGSRISFLYGGRFHVGWHAIDVVPPAPTGQRQMLTFGLDVRLWGHAAGLAEVYDPRLTPLVKTVAISPVLTCGWSVL